MTLRKDLADPADPRDRSALPLHARPRTSPPPRPPHPAAGAGEPPDPLVDEELDEDSARPLPDPQDEGRF